MRLEYANSHNRSVFTIDSAKYVIFYPKEGKSADESITPRLRLMDFSYFLTEVYFDTVEALLYIQIEFTSGAFNPESLFFSN